MHVSVVIPNYNYEKTLRAVLDSVYAQTHPPVQVIVVDDASADSSRDIIRTYPCTLLESPVNRGVSAARNRGAAAAHGEVIFFLDADTALAPDAIANAVAILEAEPEVGCVHGLIDTEPLFDDGWVERYRVLHHHVGRLRGLGLVSTAYFAAAAIRRDVFERAGPFDERLRDSEDVEYSNRLIEHCLIRLSDRVVAFHDDVERLWPLLTETFRRSQLQLPHAAAHRMKRGALKGNSLLGVAAAPLIPATLPLPVLVHPLWMVVPLLSTVLFAIANPMLSKVALRTGGPRFLAFVTGVNFLAHLALWAGAVTGAVRSMGPKARTAVAAVFLLAAAIGIGYTLRGQGWHAIGRLWTRDNAGLLLLSLGANAAGLALGAWSWRRLLVDLGGRVSVRDSARIWAAGMFGKYIPGRLWGMLAHVHMGRGAGVPTGRMAATFLVSFGIVMLTGAGIGTLAVTAGQWWLWLAVASVPLAVGLARPDLITVVIGWLARLARRPAPDRAVTPAGMRAAIGLALASWAVAGLHVWALAVAAGADPLSALPAGIGGFALGTVAGSAALFLPDGWGARELTQIAALGAVLPLADAGAVALASRIVCIVAEVGGAAAVMALTFRRKATSEGYPKNAVQS